tara:strand:- start:978 stop:1412 length:435 start_codon:yes stop_codon:yes gene_type:complete
MSYKGRYTLRNYKKYIGNPQKIIYRSLWERKFMVYCDSNPSIVAWASEEIAIPYLSPLDGEIHRYFPDFFIKVKQKDNTIKNIIIEVKPKIQCSPPKIPKRKTKQYLQEVRTWSVNEAKWKAAQKYCIERGFNFQLITEKELRI